MREALIRALTGNVVNRSYEEMADLILPRLVDPLASRLHQYEHASHLASTGCWTGHRVKARWLLGLEPPMDLQPSDPYPASLLP